jgi:F-type H+-transporting ATPase subunit alpha
VSGSVLDEAARALEQLRLGLPDLRPRARITHLGRVLRSGDGVAVAAGLDRPRAGELLDVCGVPARVESISGDAMRLVLLGASETVGPGAPVRRQGRILDVPVGLELLGRVIDPLGRPLDGGGPLATRRRVPVEQPPVPLVDREPVSRPLRTGVLVLDTMIPVGRGQRQLVVGDRATGKTEICLEILATQEDVIPIYVAIGRRGAEVATSVEQLAQAGALDRGLVLAADADDPPGLIHLAPYAAITIAEDLMLSGRDVLVVLDDLTTHAHVHRSLSLLLRRPVGREAFPADVFYAHARLLERACQLGERRGGGSLSVLPIVETQSGDLTAFIPTNIVSITDGQIRLDAALAAADQVPAVDVGLSVSRVGGKAQPAFLKRAAGQLKTDYAQFLELEVFARFGSRLESVAQRRVDWGRRVRRALRQDPGETLSWAETLGIALLLACPAVVDVPLTELRECLRRGLAAMRAEIPAAWRDLEQGRQPVPEYLVTLKEIAQRELAASVPAADAGEEGGA